MEIIKDQYDVAIIGGGLAGLSLSIQLARQGFSVILFEKEKYPFHRVCGEYVSMESWRFLEELGVPLSQLQLPLIHTLQLTAPNGRAFSARLPLGGFGISRYTLDHLLAQRALQSGVTLLQETRVEDVAFNELFYVSFTTRGVTTSVAARLCCGAFGKRSNLDVRWKRPFISQVNPRYNNYIGIKYHVKTDWPSEVIGLHNFKDGYCGISKVEGDKYCLCYMTTADNLKRSGNSLPHMEGTVLAQNPVLHELFSKSLFEKDFPVTIAQISFSKKSQAEKNVLLVGDAAGMIAPLCGNGMSMALHSSKLSAGLIRHYLLNHISLPELVASYQRVWAEHFSSRLATGRLLQGFFGRSTASNLFVRLFITFPFLAGLVIKKTHGRPF